MPCSLRNPGVEPLSLPSPFKGILNHGQSVMVNVSAATAIELLGGASFLGGVDIHDWPDYAGSFDSFYLDPSTLVQPVIEARLATTANDSIAGLAARDGVVPVAGDLVLVKNHATGSSVGLYVAAAGAWARSELMPAGAHVAGRMVQIAEGTVNADVTFVCTSNAPTDIVGTSSLTFVAGTALDSLLVHKAGTETITGQKTFSLAPAVPGLRDPNGVAVLNVSTTASAVRGATFTPGATGTNAKIIGSGENGAGLDFRADPLGTPGSIRLRNPADSATMLGVQPTAGGAPSLTALMAAPAHGATVTVTADAPAGFITFHALDTAITVNCSALGAQGAVFATVQGIDATLLSVRVNVTGAGQFVLTGNAAATGTVTVAFFVLNPSS